MSSDDKFQKEVEKRLLDLEKVAKEIFEQIELIKHLLAAPSPEKPKTISVETCQREESTLPDCLHYFGYLRFLQKTDSIPDECLTCQKVIECFEHIQ
jgi:hypothetical protein